MEAPLINFISRLLEHPTTFVHVNLNTIVDGLALKNNDLNIQLNIFSDKYNGAYLELFPLNSQYHKPFMFQPNYRFNDYNEVTPFIKAILNKLDSQNIKEEYASQYIQLWRQVLKKEKLSDGFMLEENSYAFYLKKDGFQLSSMEKKHLNINVFSASWTSPEPLCLVKIPFNITQHKPAYEQFLFYIPKYDFKNYPLLTSPYNFDIPVLKEASAKYKRHNHISTSLDDWLDKLRKDPEIKQLELFNLMQYEQLSQSLNVENNSKLKKLKL
jgi:hypothetical protein